MYGTHPVEMGPLLFKVSFNTSFIFGLFKEASHFMRIVVTSVSLGIITTIAFYFYTFLQPELKFLKWGMTIMLVGIWGNGVEKLLFGHVLDYVSVQFWFLKNIFFNLNDVYQIVGFGFIIKELFHKQESIWFPGTKRNRVFVYKELQSSLTMKILVMFMLGSLSQIALTISLLFPYLTNTGYEVETLYISCFFILNTIFLPILGIFILKELLRCFGPIFALEKYLNGEHKSGRAFKLRKTDYFKSLESSVNHFVEQNKSENK